MIPLIPYKRISIKTPLSIDSIVQAMSKVIAAPRDLFQEPHILNGKFYEGKVSSQGFEIQRIIYTRNTFLPVLYGKFIAEETGTQVDVQIVVHPAALILFALMFLLPSLGITFLTLLLSIIRYDNGLYLYSGGFFVAGYLLMTLSFGFEAKDSERYITEFFERNQPR